MKVLIIDSGGREHAIAYGLNKSPRVDEIHAIPGNPGIAQIGTCHPGSVEDLEGVLKFVEDNSIDFTVVGPEISLCVGLAGLLEERGHKVFGPTEYAATLEGSKAFPKDLMARHRIPTAAYKEADTYNEAVAALTSFTYPVVIKTDGLTAGKGVVICGDEKATIEILKEMMIDGSLDGAGSKVVLEEFLAGFECSLLCFTGEKTIVPMVSVKDHKQIYDENKGLNTGGMGTVSSNPFMPEGMNETIQKDIPDPLMAGLAKDHMDYRDVVFIGSMIGDGKAKVPEFNVRFGDPETQSTLLRLNSDLSDIMYAVSTSTLDKVNVPWKDEYVACLVLAAPEYPGSYPKGSVITGFEKIDNDIVIFHAETALGDKDEVVINGDHVLNICALGCSLEETREKTYKVAEVVQFDGQYYRKDIGLS